MFKNIIHYYLPSTNHEANQHRKLLRKEFIANQQQIIQKLLNQGQEQVWHWDQVPFHKTILNGINRQLPWSPKPMRQ